MWGLPGALLPWTFLTLYTQLHLLLENTSGLPLPSVLPQMPSLK